MFDSEGAFAPDVRTRRDCTVRDAPRRARMHAAEAPRDGRCCPADVAPRTQARAGARAAEVARAEARATVTTEGKRPEPVRSTPAPA